MNRKFFPAALLLAALISTVFFSCKKETIKFKDDVTKDYFPLELGRWVMYDVDSTIWDDFAQVKSLHRYQMLYTLTDSFTIAKKLYYAIDVQIRPNDTFSWQAHRVIHVSPDDNRIEYTEANVRFIKLIFPVTEGAAWQGNSLIPADDQDYQYLQDWNYEYKDFEVPFNNGKVHFPNTVTVLQVDEELNNPETMPDAYAFRTYGKEVYGYDVGLVYREITHWVYQPTNKYRSGYSVVMRAVDHN